jgi:hypothetical protein
MRKLVIVLLVVFVILLGVAVANADRPRRDCYTYQDATGSFEWVACPTWERVR